MRYPPADLRLIPLIVTSIEYNSKEEKNNNNNTTKQNLAADLNPWLTKDQEHNLLFSSLPALLPTNQSIQKSNKYIYFYIYLI